MLASSDIVGTLCGPRETSTDDAVPFAEWRKNIFVRIDGPTLYGSGWSAWKYIFPDRFERGAQKSPVAGRLKAPERQMHNKDLGAASVVCANKY